MPLLVYSTVISAVVEYWCPCTSVTVTVAVYTPAAA